MYVFEFAYSCNIYMYVCTIYIDIHKFTYISLHMSHACIWSYVSSHEYFSSSIQKQKRYRDEITCGSEAESITGSPSRSRRRVEGGGKPVNCMIFVNIEILVQWIRHDRRIICIRVECRPYIKILFFPLNNIMLTFHTKSGNFREISHEVWGHFRHLYPTPTPVTPTTPYCDLLPPIFICISIFHEITIIILYNWPFSTTFSWQRPWFFYSELNSTST